MKRLLTYGLLLLTILAGHFVVSACQDDLPENTEVMMTFTTRAVVTQGNESDAINIEKMNDLRVIVVRENGDIVYNDTRQVGGASTATVSFQTPVKTGGENFKFFAIANYSSLVNEPNYTDIDGLITHEVGDGNEIPISNPIPQTKYWEYPVKQLLNEIQSITKQLDFVVSKISVQFINTYDDAAQTLSNIHITGITPNGKGRLFNEPTGEKDDKGEEIYEEVYVTTNDVTLIDGKIDFGTITVNAATDDETPTSSAINHYYTYPVDNGNISSPTLHATWNGKNYTLPLEGITELKRNDHLKIIVTLTGHALTINYSIAPWVEEPTNIGSPTTSGGYQVDGWGNGNDIIIGGEIGGGEDPEPDTPDEPVGEGEVSVWSGSCPINWSNSDGTGYLYIDTSLLENAATVTGPNDLSGIQMYVYYTGTGDMQIRNGNNDNNQYGELYLNGVKNGYLSGLTGEKVSVFIPNEVKDTPFTFSGQNYTITQITVMK